MGTESFFTRAEGSARVREPGERHPRAAEPATLLLSFALAVGGAVVGMEIVSSLGVTPNTSMVGVVVAILAGDEGGRRARVLGLGAAAGIVGSSGLFGALGTMGVGTLPMAAFGIAFLGNPWALGMFGVGLLVRGYAGPLAGLDLDTLLAPHGMMIGAGVAAFTQAVAMVLRRPKNPPWGSAPFSRSEGDARAGLAGGLALYLVAAAILAALGGLWTAMAGPRLVVWIAFAAVACVAAELIVGLSAMQAGWFPAFATALVFLLLALALGFPAGAAALLVGFVASGGPAFADAGYDLKTGWLLRGFGRDRAFELAGRWQQVLAALVGLLTALAVVSLFHTAYFREGAFPPMARVYAAAIGAGVEPETMGRLILWALPGALLQLLGGSGRQLGILFATGLLIPNPLAGWAVFLALAIRGILAQRMGSRASPLTVVLAGGIIAGDALWGFVGSLVR